MTQQQATELEQAIKTAQKNGHRVYTATVNATGATCYTVRSHSDPNTFHILHIDAGRIRCDCSRHHHGHICSHAACVRLFLLAQRESLKQVEARDEQEREAERLASLPRTLAEVTTSEEQKLAQIERDAALPKERVLDRQAPSFGRLPLCEMCEEAPASHFDEQPRCDDCQKIAARHALLRAEHAAEKARAHNERAAKREQALLASHVPEGEFSIYKS